MKNNVLHAMRNTATQPLSENLMDATRAIQENLQNLSPMLKHYEVPSGDTREPGRSSSRVGPVSDSVIAGDFARVDRQQDEVQSPGTDRPAADAGELFCTGDFVHAGASVNYRLYLPPASLRNGALLVMLHGCTQEATDFSTGTAMNRLAREAGYTVLYPTQNAAANLNRCWNWFLPAHQQRGAGEPALLSALTQFVCHQQGLNQSRVFVAGLSAGGAMALILAEEFPEVYAGVGVHSGLATGLANSAPQALRAMTGSGTPAPLNPATRHRPTLVIHGDQDQTVNPHNAGVIVERCLGQYRQQHTGEKLNYQCHDETVGEHLAKRHEFRNHDGVVVCRHLQLGSIGHAWSGGDARGSHTAVGGICASESLLSFFDQCSSLAS